MYDFRLIERSHLGIVMPLIQLLNPKTEESVLAERLEAMQSTDYQCLGVFDGEKLIGICGFWILNKFYVGKHIEPDNVVILPEYRNQGIGEQMMAWVLDYGRQHGCIASELNVYVHNSPAVKFYLNMGYKILGFHLQKPL
jgi:GNAT superfamily N-acetyltransferase